MISAQFRRNRAAFPRDELAKYQGKWVAFDPTGSKIVAADEDLIMLDQQVKAAGYDPEEVAFEGVPGPNDHDLANGDIT
jgi:hypothetical protein